MFTLVPSFLIPKYNFGTRGKSYVRLEGPLEISRQHKLPADFRATRRV